MRILVLGASGQLGTDLVRAGVAASYDVTGLTHGDCDVTNVASVRDALQARQPDVVVNCAAWTKVDGAEAHEPEATRINGAGAGNVATVCAELGVRLCHLSTDYVFDGSASEPIREDTNPNPVSAYGRSKLAGERAVRDVLGDGAIIVRTAWLYGADGPNFVLTMLKLARERGELRVVADQVGSPTWAGDLAPAILRLLEHDTARGIFHITNSGETSWHGFAVAIMERVGLTAVPVHAITTSEYPTPAVRPRYSVLDNTRWCSLGEPPLPPWRDGLAGYLRTSGA